MPVPLIRNRIAWTYVDDAGNHWRVGAMKAYTSQNKLGGFPAAETVPALPATIKPRRIQLRRGRNATDPGRSIVVYSVPSPIMTVGAFINLNVVVAGVDQSQSFYNRHSPRTVLVPERHPHKGTATNQPA